MRHYTRLHSGLSAALLALLCVTATGLPSHGHAEAEADGEGPALVAVDHHDHEVTLVEWQDQTPSTGVQVASLPTAPTLLPIPSHLPVLVTPTTALRPRERAPPPGAPRAPPRTI
jgi:hypothetical protein